MDKKNTSFNLLELLTDSLSLQINTTAPTRNMFPFTSECPYAKITQQNPLDVLGERSFGPPKHVPKDVISTPIQEFYVGLNVFITGGTGFLGKILTEKLIRSVPHIGHIYLLIRGKRGKSCQERFKLLLEDKVFSRMKAEVEDYASKVSAVEGDISSHDLGLSAADRQMLLDSCHVVIHSAADVRFIEPLKVAIEANVYGAQRVLSLAKEMKHLKSYIHISTAYSQCVRRVVHETVPKLAVDYKEILNYIASKSNQELEDETPRIMLGWPNTYTFSKAVCEDMLQDEAKGLPFCILRPSVVVMTAEEPVRGWTDNLYGPMGMLVGAGHGILHCALVDVEMTLDVVPVDYVVNCTIAVAWSIANHRYCDKLQVYNCVSNATYQTCWKHVIDTIYKHNDVWPFDRSVWHASFFTLKSVTVYKIMSVLLHKVPGKIFDKLLELSGQKPILSKLYRRIETLDDQLDYFGSRVWEFKNDNVMNLLNTMDEEDKRIFNFDIRGKDLVEMSLVGKLGIKYYYLKEKMENLPAAESKHKRLYWIHNVTKLVFMLAVLKLMVLTARVLPL